MNRVVGQPPVQAVVQVGKTVAATSSPIDIVLLKADGSAYVPLEASAAAHQAASTAADVATLKTDFNALLTKLQAAGLMA